VEDGLVVDDVIYIPGMSCQGCALNIKRALIAVPGVRSAEVDEAQKVALIRFNPSKVELGKLIEAIERAGYEAFPG
jgi:copper chaperone CopZ